MRKGLENMWQKMLAAIAFVFILYSGSMTAYAAGEGWIEVRSEVPEGMNSYIILSIVNEETQEDFDIAVLPDNDFYAREKVPQGTYSVAAAWVFQDYRYTVKADSEKFKVGKDAAAPINLTVTVPKEEPAEEVDIEKTFETNLDEDSIFADLTGTDDEDDASIDNDENISDEDISETEKVEQPEETEMSAFSRGLILLLGMGILAFVTAGITLFIRRYY